MPKRRNEVIYEIADLRVWIKNRCRYTTEFCKDYLSSDQESPADLEAEVTNEEFYAEKAVSEEGYPDGYIENICIYRKICMQMPKFDRFLMHSAVLTVGKDGYAFLGRSGAGKSTHTELWLKYVNGAKILNGDKPIIHYENGELIAYGTPWMGKEGRGEKGKAPIMGLCFIEQAKENSIRRLSVRELTERIFSQLLLPQEEEGAAKTLELADKLVSNVPAYVLRCDISKEAAKTSFEAMTGQKLD